MLYFLLGMVMVGGVHWALTASRSIDAASPRARQWARFGTHLAFFLIAGRYFPWIWHFYRPRRFRTPNATSPSPSLHTVEEARALLGVLPQAGESDIRRAFRAKMRTAHPDHGGTAEAASRLIAARECLLNHLKTGTTE